VTDPRVRAARRAALDHLLGLIAALPWSDGLVLRGSMLMCAWAAGSARDPADLDFVVLPDLSVPIDPFDPLPHVAVLDAVQQWPEAADGAARYEIWKDGDEEFHTGGIHAIAAPEGLNWAEEPDRSELTVDYHHDLVRQLRLQPQAAADVLLAPDRVRTDDSWTYAYGGDGPGGIRIIVPWSAPDLPGGEVHIDLAMDERLPEAPVWALIPRAGAAAPLVVRAASRGLSLAWKLHWLRADSTGSTGPRPKDLYDAVILAEDGRTRLSARLLKTILGRSDATIAATTREFGISGPEQADWEAFTEDNPGISGTAHDWRLRLDTALARLPSPRQSAQHTVS
jgi:hypothetical protein